ncbi:MAG: hypothetical protein WBM61_08670 [Woeseiaceae bacterium]|jgi:hypothetical protein
MTPEEVYEGLRLIVRTYIDEALHEELLTLLDTCDTEDDFPPGKVILHRVNTDSNGVELKPEHFELWSSICHHCV